MTKADSTQRTMKKARKSAARTKATGKRNAGKALMAGEVVRVPRSAKVLALAIHQRLKRSPGYWRQVEQQMRLLDVVGEKAVLGQQPDMTAH